MTVNEKPLKPGKDNTYAISRYPKSKTISRPDIDTTSIYSAQPYHTTQELARWHVIPHSRQLGKNELRLDSERLLNPEWQVGNRGIASDLRFVWLDVSNNITTRWPSSLMKWWEFNYYCLEMKCAKERNPRGWEDDSLVIQLDDLVTVLLQVIQMLNLILVALYGLRVGLFQVYILHCIQLLLVVQDLVNLKKIT